MTVTTRSGRASATSSPTKRAAMTPNSTPSRRPTGSKPSPYLLLIYPIILALGSLFSTISPVAAPSGPAMAFAPGLSSDLNTPVAAPSINYFAGKRNLVNLYFVKIGWFWTTLAFVLLQTTTRPARTSAPQLSHYIQAAARYALVTLSWIFTTQWLFGPALIDRSFTITGGHCEAHPAAIDSSAHVTGELARLSSSAACKAAGGRWRGGHDISGHVFMLVLSSAFLLLELYLADRHSAHPSVTPKAAAAVAAATSEDEKKAVGGWESQTTATVRIWARYAVYAVVALDLWMLMMTAIWFHTWLEKLSGLLLAASCVWLVYFLPDFAPQWRSIVGGL